MQADECETHMSQQCKQCHNGYEMTSEKACQRKQCSCQNGTGTSGEACHNNGQEMCMSCDEGYNLSGTVCQQIIRGLGRNFLLDPISTNTSLQILQGMSNIDHVTEAKIILNQIEEEESENFEIADPEEDEILDQVIDEGIELEDDELKDSQLEIIAEQISTQANEDSSYDVELD